jgi:hypothetical protein
MSKTDFPTHVAVQNDAPHPDWQGYPDKFHRVGANHIAKGAHYTRKITLARALKERWEPCRVCFRDLLASPAERLKKALAIAQQLSDAELLMDLPDPAGPVRRVGRASLEPERSGKVVAITLRRASHRCEMPGCKAELFSTEAGTPYLEVHHLTWLSDNGPDHPINTAALCPSHHKQLHFGKDRLVLLETIRPVVAKAHAAFVALAAAEEAARQSAPA